MADWSTFFGFVGVILVLLLALARASQPVVSDATRSSAQPTPALDASDESGGQSAQPGTQSAESSAQPTVSSDSVSSSMERSIQAVDGSAIEADRATSSIDRPDGEHHAPTDPAELPALSTPAVLANVAISQGMFAVLVVSLAWYTEIPAWAFGLASESLTLGAVGTGIVVGGVLYILNEAAATIARQWGLSTPTALREALAPASTAGWAVLLGVVLPIIAGFEELLFRGALVGVAHAGFGISPWLLAVGSSVAFALGHGAQGRLGIIVTGLLGVGLAIVFIYTGSLIVVMVAHYVINALEFVVHEGIDPMVPSHTS